ncbi:MAG TPA: flagellar hook protein FlgE [Dongiaceae bacterium]|jgi:flagellar hook protein FlgE|nr:flagellar hook protein FlgE [Dongiaceae bacterium]
MSLGGAINSAVSALNAQSQALAMISDNISNSSTVGYKSSAANFSALVTQQYGSVGYASGGVSVSSQRNVGQQGLIQSASSSTSLALDGSGLFVVAEISDSGKVNYAYTRDGQFSTNEDGQLANAAGYLLMGYPVDENGDALAGSVNYVTDLEPIDLDSIGGTAEATANVTLAANLPADAEVGDSFTTDVEIFDSLGLSHDVTLTWNKTAANSWELSFSNPTASGDSSAVTGTSSGGPITINFNSDGTLAGLSPAGAELTITGWTTGAADSTIAFDLGEADSATGLTQYASGEDEPDVEIDTLEADGARYGTLVDVSIGEDGLVTANFENGLSRPIYRIPVAVFANPDGLQALSGNLYLPTGDSGDYLLKTAGVGSTATIQSSALESSTVDIADEFSKMIVAQQAYSAASKVVSTANEMMDTLINAVR